jgi:hypothetical protein
LGFGCLGVWVLGFVSRGFSLGFGFWVLGFEVRRLGFGFWVFWFSGLGFIKRV